MRSVLCAVVVALAVTGPASPSIDREMVQDAEAIVVASVASTRSYYGFDGRIRTRAELLVDSILKGDVGDRLEVDELGGTVGNTTMLVPQLPSYAAGQHCLVFLVRDAVGTWRTLRGISGKAEITADALVSGDGSVWERTDVLRFVEQSKVSAFAKPPHPLAVPSRFLITQTKPSANGTETKPVRWPSFGTSISFVAAGSQPGLGDGGTSALQAALGAWSAAPTSSIRLSYGGTTSVTTAAQDGINSVVFNDPQGVINGSYTAEQFTGSGTLARPRWGHTATLLGDASVLIAGGTGSSGVTGAAEIYSAGTSSLLAASLTPARWLHTATLLPEGTVLFTGGLNTTTLASAQLFDAVSKTFSDTAAAMSVPRRSHTATLLGAVGDVLIAGGVNDSGTIASAEIFHSSTGGFSAANGSMTSPRVLHTATWLPNGRVLIAGGSDGLHALNTAEIYDPATKTFTATAGNMTAARKDAAAVLIDDVSGQVLISGGSDDTNALNTAEIFDPTSGTFSSVTSTMSSGRQGHAAIRLSSNAVLIAGGTNGTTALNSVEVFEAAPPAFAPRSATMSVGRSMFTATRLNGGAVLLAGGSDTASSSFEKYVFPVDETLGLTQLWIADSSHTFAGSSFWSILEADVILQDGLTAPGTSNGGLSRLLAQQIGMALGFAQTNDTSVLNPNFDFNATPFASTLQTYDRDAAATVYPAPTVGDVNGDATVNAADIFYLLDYLFRGGSVPAASADVNGDGRVDVADLFYLINYIFAGGPAPR